MAYDPKTGLWSSEDDSVSGKLNGLLASNSPYLDQARAGAQRTANSRGLLNTSIAAGAGESAAIGAALPIAAQDAAQTNTKNASAQGYSQTGLLQGQQIQGQKDVTGLQTTSQEKIASGQQASSERIAAAAQEGETARTQLGITSQQQLQATDLKAQNDRLAAQLGSQATLQAAQLAAQKEQQGVQITSDEKKLIQQLNAAKDQLSMQLTTQTQNTQASIASNDREKAAAAVSSAQTRYQNTVTQIENNKDLPAEARQAYIQAAQTQLNSDMALVEQLYGIQLTWPQTTQTTTAPPGPPQVTVP